MKTTPSEAKGGHSTRELMLDYFRGTKGRTEKGLWNYLESKGKFVRVALTLPEVRKQNYCNRLFNDLQNQGEIIQFGSPKTQWWFYRVATEAEKTAWLNLQTQRRMPVAFHRGWTFRSSRALRAKSSWAYSERQNVWWCCIS
jgi:hypothetical protein